MEELEQQRPERPDVDGWSLCLTAHRLWRHRRNWSTETGAFSIVTFGKTEVH